jgi:hypothetical protein
MKNALFATALIALAPAARAQVVTIDPTAIIQETKSAVNTLQEVKNGFTQINGMIHGNGFADLVPGLGSGIASNPLASLGTSGAASLMSGTGAGGGLSGLYNQFRGQVSTYQPSGNDPEAQMLQQRANAAAGQMAVGQQFMSGTSSRLTQLPQLLGALGSTADIKDSMDANTRVNAEQTTQGAQSAQLQALAIYQHGEDNAERAREELAMRKGADELVSRSQAAADDAAAGNVTLVHN